MCRGPLAVFSYHFKLDYVVSCCADWFFGVFSRFCSISRVFCFSQVEGFVFLCWICVSPVADAPTGPVGHYVILAGRGEMVDRPDLVGPHNSTDQSVFLGLDVDQVEHNTTLPCVQGRFTPCGVPDGLYGPSQIPPPVPGRYRSSTGNRMCVDAEIRETPASFVATEATVPRGGREGAVSDGAKSSRDGRGDGH